VREPNIEDTIAILRGLKEKYEIHHGVRIQNSAILAAANLSERYITDRFLPDKAIDLIDEAASRLRIEIDSLPTEIDDVERDIMRLEIERQALSKEKDTTSKDHRKKIEQEIAQLKERSNAMKARWKNEVAAIQKARDLKEQLEIARHDLEEAKRRGDLNLAAKLMHGDIPALEQQLEEENQKLTRVNGEKRMLKEEVDEDDVAGVVSQWTGIPVAKMLEGELSKLLRMEERLKERVVGQDEAIRLVSEAVRRARAGLQDPRRPIRSFLFMGPTGVGKTELSRALAEFLFDDENAMVRIDMSEYMEKHAVARLIGAPPGYVGYEEGGQLTEMVRRRPYAVVLLDEIEKAHRDVFNILLQLLDDGRLTDGQGRTVDFSNAVVIMTSNVGSEYIYELGGQDDEEMERLIQESLKASFRPEFLNRIDEMVIFKSLGLEELKGIVKIQLRYISKLLDARKIELELTDQARNHLARVGYDPAFGARPLKRAMQTHLLNPLSDKILKGEVREGDHLMADVSEEGILTFTPA